MQIGELCHGDVAVIEESNIFFFHNVAVHGVDLVDMSSFSRLITKQASSCLDRYFTPGELAAAGEGGDRIDKLASRFAIKESVLKALGTGWGDGVSFTDVEVVLERRGAPSIILHRRLVAMAEEQGIVRWLVSASHAGSITMASVIGLKLSRLCASGSSSER